MNDVTLNEEPTNGELLTAVQALRRGGSVTTKFGQSAWALACVRYVKGLGPDMTDDDGQMRYDRVHDVAEASGSNDPNALRLAAMRAEMESRRA